MIEKPSKHFRWLALPVVASLMLSSCIETFEMTRWGPVMHEDVEEEDIKTDHGAKAQVVRGHKVKSEELLDADGHWSVVEANRGYDPAAAHLEARNKVNRNDFSKHDELAAHFEPNAKSGQDGTVRVLKVQPKGTNAASVLAEYEKVEQLPPIKQGEDPYLEKKPKPKFDPKAPIPKRKPRLETAAVDMEPKPKSSPVSDVLVAYHKMDTEEVLKITGGVPVPRRKANTPARFDEKPAAQSAAPQEPQEKEMAETPIDTNGVPIPKRKPTSAALKAKGYAVNASSPEKNSQIYEKGQRATKQASVINIRSGEHSGRARVVIELDEKTKYKAAVDPLRNVLRIMLENTRWPIDNQAALSGSPLLGTYIARTMKGSDVLLEVRLKKATQILSMQTLPPNNSAKHRVVIDLKK